MRFLSNKEKKQLKEKLLRDYSFDKKDEVKEDKGIYYLNSVPFLIEIDGILVPHLKSVKTDSHKYVMVDHGAVPFLIKGADMMRPGITHIDSGILEGDLILIKDEVHKKALAFGFALFNSEDMEKQEKGKSVKVLHYVGDGFY